MHDMTAFERQVASELVRRAGPVRPVDDVAILSAITAQTKSPTWRFRSMFSATKFVIAGATVALFGGLLMAGLLPRSGGDELAPAAVSPSASPSPQATEGPLAGMVFEEVEPGVVRIIDDGADHDLDERHPTNRYDLDGITVGRDGTVWLRSTYSGSDNDVAGHDGKLLWALGRPGMHNVSVPEGTLVSLDDGSLLAVGDRVARFDGQAFVPDDGPKQRPLGDGAWLWIIEPDELMGLVAEGGSAERPGERLAVIWDGGAWRSLSEFGRGTDRGIGRCSGGPNGVICINQLFNEEYRYLEGTRINHVAIAPDGTIWAAGEYDGENGALYRITPE